MFHNLKLDCNSLGALGVSVAFRAVGFDAVTGRSVLKEWYLRTVNPIICCSWSGGSSQPLTSLNQTQPSGLVLQVTLFGFATSSERSFSVSLWTTLSHITVLLNVFRKA